MIDKKKDGNMSIENVKKKLEALEKELFCNKAVKLDSANLILKFGVNNYLNLVEQINSYKPKSIIHKMDASAKYLVRERFGKEAFNRINKLIDDGIVELTPAKRECDPYLIQACLREKDSVLVSLDAFNDFNRFWISPLRVIKPVKFNSRFYFNHIDLKAPLDKTANGDKTATNNLENPTPVPSASGIEFLDRLSDSTGELDLYTSEEGA